MKEIILKENQSERKCYIDDLPIKDLIPKEQIEIFITALAREIEEIIKTKEKRRAYYEKSKVRPEVPP